LARHRVPLAGETADQGFVEIQLPPMRNALSTLDGSQGGFTTYDGLLGAWQLAMDSLSLRGLTTLERVPRGGQWTIPTVDDVANEGQILLENTISTTQDVVFGAKVAKPTTLGSRWVRVPNSLLEDGERYSEQLIGVLGRRVARLQNRLAIEGTGVGQPLGLTKAVSTASATAGAITTANIGDLLNAASSSVYDDENNRPTFVMHKTIWTTLLKSLDGAGKPIWIGDDALRLAGFGVVLNSAMPAVMTAGTVSVLFGDFKRVKTVEANEMRLVSDGETLGEYNVTRFQAILRTDIVLPDAGDHPIVGLLHT
jgi:HK97 family phage major capsid protein